MLPNEQCFYGDWVRDRPISAVARHVDAEPLLSVCIEPTLLLSLIIGHNRRARKKARATTMEESSGQWMFNGFTRLCIMQNPTALVSLIAWNDAASYSDAISHYRINLWRNHKDCRDGAFHFWSWDSSDTSSIRQSHSSDNTFFFHCLTVCVIWMLQILRPKHSRSEFQVRSSCNQHDDAFTESHPLFIKSRLVLYGHYSVEASFVNPKFYEYPET